MQCVGKFEFIMFEIITMPIFLDVMCVKTLPKINKTCIDACIKELIYGYFKRKLYKLKTKELTKVKVDVKIHISENTIANFKHPFPR